MNRLPFLFALTLFFGFNSCESPTDQSPKLSQNKSAKAAAIFVGNKEFDEYWYQGKAELNSYVLEQARYGEVHPGEAVLVFVTEPFSKSKQVKLDYPGAQPKDEVSVMKLNLTKKFYTGVYPYSIMQSSFTPIDIATFPNTLKVATSSQEWCGHTFTQYNLNDQGYKVQQFSYFESEGDEEMQLGNALLEDEIWSKIRIKPSSLPTGSIKIIPGSIYSRLRHTELKVEEATASLSPSKINKEHLNYQVEYKNGRTLSIQFSKSFPHIIEGWEESFKSGFGAGAKQLTSKARLKKTLLLDYWSKNGLMDAKYRDLLELD